MIMDINNPKEIIHYVEELFVFAGAERMSKYFYDRVFDNNL